MNSIRSTGVVSEIEEGAVRIRLGAPGHEHRILFLTSNVHAYPVGQRVRVTIEPIADATVAPSEPSAVT